MLKSIRISNFKAFGAPSTAELAPITLILGQNSAGKSSILQVLNLLKQTYESRESGASLLPRAGIVDLGSFRELLFDHDTSRTLRVGLELAAIEPRPSRYRRHPYSDQPIALSLGFGQGGRGSDVAVQELTVSLGASSATLAEFGMRSISQAEQREANYRMHYRVPFSAALSRRAGRRQRLTVAECRSVTSDPRVWGSIYQPWHDSREEVKSSLLATRDELLGRKRRVREAVEEEAAAEEDRALSRAFAAAVDFYSDTFSLDKFVDRMVKGWKGTTVLLDGFLPVQGRIGGNVGLPEVEYLEYRPNRPWLPMYDVVGITLTAGRRLEELLSSLFPMGPFRHPPQRWYIFTGTSPEDVGYKGDHLPDLLFRRPELVDQANDWLRRLEIEYRLQVKPIGDHDSDLFEVRLIDTRRSGQVEVGLSDVGFGISQILPFLVQTLASRAQVISIEQPEVHIHPRLQAELGELLAEAIRPPHGHQFLVETHSEHLLLRLLRLIRAGRLSPQDVSVIYVERGVCGSRVQRLRIDATGDFIDEWPGGFFPERLNELL